MEYADEIPVVFENGVFRPEAPVRLPENSRMRILLRDSGTDANSKGTNAAAPSFTQVRSKGLLKSGGWHPTRDELHERG